MKMRDFF